ncbi:MAG: hypothetical protein H7X86_08830 [Gorillibacterium sp.]|nr:hypothetical protein [Gorillibacterium sp.]
MILDMFKRFLGQAPTVLSTDEAVHTSGSIPVQKNQIATKERQEEMIDLERVFREFGIGLDHLIKSTPPHINLRLRLIKASQQLAQDAEIMRELIKLKHLPVDEFAQRSGLSRKITKQHSKYLISIALIYYGPYPNIRQYLQTDIPQK